ncbi:hypothetical protein OSB04_016562 [Centaurea solstitialis]|uniref:Myb/SANT-like domain-containing protein n=1 Tax=Centaurea solstitialis TaxID=347529 RepID=A0AA38W8L5_9ASTR|nr:hypothetical protein OSB04_016562 [Centaurea solstitialis]
MDFLWIGMEQSGESNHQKRPRISWKDHNVVKTFLEACILEVGLNGKEGSSLKALSWKKVAETLKTTHNFIVDRKQMRNHFDYLKGKYGAWLKLKNKTGNVYDPSTNTFNLTPEEWDLEIESNRFVESLRTTSLPFPDLCARLFEGGMSVGLGGHGPRSKDPLPTTEPFVVINDEVPVSSDQDPLSSSPTPTSRAPVAKPKGKKNANVNSDLDDKLIKFLDHMSSKYNPEVVSYEACLKKLDDLGWEKDDPLYGIAIALLTDNGNREAWMTIPEATAKVWVKAVGKKDGYFLYIYVRRRRIASERIERMPDNTSALSGYAYTQELLTGSSTQCQELMRLSREDGDVILQRNVVFACVAIHNFIRKYNIQDQLFMEINEDTIFNNEEEAEGSGEEELDISQWGANNTEYMATLRDGIANRPISNGLDLVVVYVDVRTNDITKKKEVLEAIERKSTKSCEKVGKKCKSGTESFRVREAYTFAPRGVEILEDFCFLVDFALESKS